MKFCEMNSFCNQGKQETFCMLEDSLQFSILDFFCIKLAWKYCSYEKQVDLSIEVNLLECITEVRISLNVFECVFCSTMI